jgi:hypothetical protein
MAGALKITRNIHIVSLLQPPPETFGLFDGLILVSEGQVIYSGPVDKVVHHFESLGYMIPERMDVADWLQVSLSLARLVPSFNVCSLPPSCTLTIKGDPNKRRERLSSK